MWGYGGNFACCFRTARRRSGSPTGTIHDVETMIVGRWRITPEGLYCRAWTARVVEVEDPAHHLAGGGEPRDLGRVVIEHLSIGVDVQPAEGESTRPPCRPPALWRPRHGLDAMAHDIAPDFLCARSPLVLTGSALP